MITREEFAIMQKQMVDMNDEKLDMLAQIKTLKESITQIDLIKKSIDEIKLSKEKEESSYNEEMSKVQSKVNNLTDQLRNIDDLSKQKSWDAKKLTRLENSLQELISTTVNQDNTIEDLNQKIEEFKLKQSEIDEQIKKVHTDNKNNARLIKKIESFGAIQLKISECESKLYIIQHVRKKNQKRISNLTLSKTNIAKTNDVLQQKFNDLNDELSKILESLNSIEPSVEETQSELTHFHNEELNVQEELEQLESKDHSLDTEFKEMLKTKTDKKEMVHDLSKKLDEQLNQLKQSIDQSSIERNILVNKKISLVNQLKKSIKDKIKDITRSRSQSPHVLRLIDQQEKQWVERQQLYEVYNKVEAKHKELTDLVSRKSIVLNELKDFMKTVPPLDKKYSSQPLAMLENAYQVALEENRARAANITDISQELELVEKENKELKINV